MFPALLPCSAPGRAMASAGSDWIKQDERKMLHAVYRVGDIDATAEYYKKHFGMKQLRYRDIPEVGCPHALYPLRTVSRSCHSCRSILYTAFWFHMQQWTLVIMDSEAFPSCVGSALVNDVSGVHCTEESTQTHIGHNRLDYFWQWPNAKTRCT